MPCNDHDGSLQREPEADMGAAALLENNQLASVCKISWWSLMSLVGFNGEWFQDRFLL